MSPPDSTIDDGRARELLLRERERVESALAELGRTHASDVGEIDTAADPQDDSELIEEEEIDGAIATQLRGELDAIGRAEERLREGSYGLSVESGEPIPAGRLETIPWAERTAEEQQRYESRR